MMQMHAKMATTGQKEPAQTLFILDTLFTQNTAKLGLNDSDYFQVLDFAIQLLEYKGCALAISVATEEVAFL